mmetsp:Transcript_91551/g.245245  ORF Transcript_91551/g.245245 Transcript_91551/m.245245 type:complete len:231 (+) Transcript_91551:1541-2233(+)
MHDANCRGQDVYLGYLCMGRAGLQGISHPGVRDCVHDPRRHAAGGVDAVHPASHGGGPLHPAADGAEGGRAGAEVYVPGWVGSWVRNLFYGSLAQRCQLGAVEPSDRIGREHPGDSGEGHEAGGAVSQAGQPGVLGYDDPHFAAPTHASEAHREDVHELVCEVVLGGPGGRAGDPVLPTPGPDFRHGARVRRVRHRRPLEVHRRRGHLRVRRPQGLPRVFLSCYGREQHG